MRDERWTDRFLFAWNDTLAYEALEVGYQPRKDHFLSTLDEELRSRFRRYGIWWSYRYNDRLPDQGWKIHVSATHRTAHETAVKVIEHLTTRGIDFKLALDLNIFELLNSKRVARGNGGKFITVYPHDDDEFRTCIAELAELLADTEGAYVLTDHRYRDCKALYFRYGQLLNTYTVDTMGRKRQHILGPDGPVPDDRTPAYATPWWLSWPFSDWKPDEPEPEALLGGRFRPTSAIQFSNTGGVYEAEDVANGNKKVVIKEARPHTNASRRGGYDAVDVIAREWNFLNRLADTGRFPVPVATFQQWEHHFIAEEFVEASDLRTILFEHNPLVRPAVHTDQSRQYLGVFLRVFRGLALAVQAAHQRGVILGDLSAANVLINPETFHVTVVDLEACRLIESAADDAYLQSPVDIYTEGFSHSKRQAFASAPADDLYGMALTMAYLIFPVAALSFLRDDILDLYRTYVEDLGWPASIHQLLVDVAEDRITLDELLEALDGETGHLAAVEVPGPRAVDETELGFPTTESRVSAFIQAMADPSRSTLFPADPFAHLTNPLSLGFGATGMLWALGKSGVPVRTEWLDWLRDRVDRIDLPEYPSGLLNGLAGIAWAIDDLGLSRQARMLLAEANRRTTGDYTFYYGLAGLGMTNLRFHQLSGDDSDLAAAKACAQSLRDAVQRDGEHAYWLNEFAKDGPLTGLGFGQAGVAMFLLRMTEATGDDSYRKLGRQALDWELAHAEPWYDDTVSFRHSGTLMPYVEVGSAGIAQVLLRYGDLDEAKTVLRGMDLSHSALPGYGFGLAGLAETMLDAADVLADPSYRERALRLLEHLRRIFLFEPPERFGVPLVGGVAPLALPGDGLLRCSCDLMTGSAGVLRVLHRLNHGGTADFLLDGLRS